MNIPCDKKINFCPCTDNPLANLSSEDPDRLLFIKIHYYPRLGPAPIVLCEDEDLADLANCPHPCDPTIETCPPCDCCPPVDQDSCDPCHNECCEDPAPASCIPPVVYRNHEINCTSCGLTDTIPAGTVESVVSQADADAIAQSMCEYRACRGPRRPQPPVPVPCTPDTGDPVPIGLTPFRLPLVTDPMDPFFGFPQEVEWETFSVFPGNIPASTEVIHTNPLCNPTNFRAFAWASQPDHPPGQYQFEYVSGFFTFTNSLYPGCPVCVGPNTAYSLVGFSAMQDDEHNLETIPGCGSQQVGLASRIRTIDPPPPSTLFGNAVAAFPLCSPTLAGHQAVYTAFFNTPLARKRICYFAADGGDGEHSNTGGNFRFGVYGGVIGFQSPFDPFHDAGCVDPFDPLFGMTFKVFQVDGCIEQPRTIQIIGWSTIGAQLGLLAFWDGVFTTRTNYTTSTCQWDEAGFGLFGGATCFYTQTHPTSPNGCGWVLEISGISGTIWRGYKIIDDTGDGLYMVATTSPLQTPACIRIVGI